MLNRPLTFGSLFSGIGGLDLGLERAGLKCAFHVEADGYCREVLARHWPHVPSFDDVRTVGAHNLPPVQVLAGGFPCQDLSNSGRRAGIEGARSGLWKEFSRLISELKPSYVIIENVRALLQRNNRFDTVLRDLAANGYDAEWSVHSAAASGAPHLRKRVFVVAHARGVRGGNDLWPQLFKPVDREEFPEWRTAQRLGSVSIVGRAYPQLPERFRVVDGTAGELDADTRRVFAARVKGCGNAVVPQVAAHVGRCLTEHHLRRCGP